MTNAFALSAGNLRIDRISSDASLAVNNLLLQDGLNFLLEDSCFIILE